MSTPNEEEIKKIFSTRIRELIGDRSVSRFSREIGMKQAAIDRYTKCQRSPAADAIVAIATKCGVSTDWLLGLTDEHTPGRQVVTATGGSVAAGGNATAHIHAPPLPPTPAQADTARLEELLETQRRLIATQQRLIDALSKTKK